MYVSIKLVVRFYHLRSFMDVYVCFIPYSIHRNVTTLRLKCLNLVGAAPRQRKHTNYVHDDKCFPQNWESEQLNDFWNIHPTEIRINWTTFVLDYIDHNRIIRPSIDYIHFKMPRLWNIWNRCDSLMNLKWQQHNTHENTNTKKTNFLADFNRQGSKTFIVQYVLSFIIYCSLISNIDLLWKRSVFFIITLENACQSVFHFHFHSIEKKKKQMIKIRDKNDDLLHARQFMYTQKYHRSIESKSVGLTKVLFAFEMILSKWIWNCECHHENVWENTEKRQRQTSLSPK